MNCPVCHEDHGGQNCDKFRVAYAKHNAELLAKQTAAAGAKWEPTERLALLRRARAIALQCTTRAEILAALDEMIEACLVDPHAT